MKIRFPWVTITGTPDRPGLPAKVVCAAAMLVHEVVEVVAGSKRAHSMPAAEHYGFEPVTAAVVAAEVAAPVAEGAVAGEAAAGAEGGGGIGKMLGGLLGGGEKPNATSPKTGHSLSPMQFGGMGKAAPLNLESPASGPGAGPGYIE